MALLELQGVTLGYGGPPLLEAVDLRLDPGERIALVGRNGSGKSTLLQLIHGNWTAQEGEERRVNPRIESDASTATAQGGQAIAT